jgi:branched-chain amino acid transport system substrate-binding protein
MKRSKWFSLVAVLAAFTLIASGCGRDEDGGDGAGAAECPDTEFDCVEVGADEPITIASLLTITTANKSLGQDSNAGIEIALDQRGQVAGHDVELIKEDEGCAAEGGQTGATKLVANPKIAAVIGTTCSSAGVPAAEILSDQGILLISSSNTAPDLTDPEVNYQPFYARTAHNDAVQGAAMAQFVSEELNAKSVATIHDGSPYAEGLANAMSNAFEKEYGGKVVAEEAVQVGDKEFRSVLTSIAAKGPDFLYYPVFIPEGAGITQQARGIDGLADTDLGGADGMLAPDFVEAAGDASEGMYLSGPDLNYGGDFYKNEFLPAYEKITGSKKPLASFHAHAFDATNIVLDSIEEVAVETDDGGLLIPRTQLRDAVYDTEGYKGIIGELTCNETGDCNAETTIAVNQVEGGEFNPVFTETLNLADFL